MREAVLAFRNLSMCRGDGNVELTFNKEESSYPLQELKRYSSLYLEKFK